MMHSKSSTFQHNTHTNTHTPEPGTHTHNSTYSYTHAHTHTHNNIVIHTIIFMSEVKIQIFTCYLQSALNKNKNKTFLFLFLFQAMLASMLRQIVFMEPQVHASTQPHLAIACAMSLLNRTAKREICTLPSIPLTWIVQSLLEQDNPCAMKSLQPGTFDWHELHPHDPYPGGEFGAVSADRCLWLQVALHCERSTCTLRAARLHSCSPSTILMWHRYFVLCLLHVLNVQ